MLDVLQGIPVTEYRQESADPGRIEPWVCAGTGAAPWARQADKPEMRFFG
jgi:hypothetical protein